MSREIQPLNEETRSLDPVYLPGKYGGQYMMDFQSGNKWVVKGQQWLNDTHRDTITPWMRIGAWDYATAKRVLDYCVENDVSMRAALQNLYSQGEPDLLMELVEKAKAQPTTDREIVFDIELRGTSPRQAVIEDIRCALQNALRNYFQNSRFVNFKTRGLVSVKVDYYDA